MFAIRLLLSALRNDKGVLQNFLNSVFIISIFIALPDSATADPILIARSTTKMERKYVPPAEPAPVEPTKAPVPAPAPEKPFAEPIKPKTPSYLELDKPKPVAAPEPAKPKSVAVKVKVDDGLKIQSEDKAYSYQIGGRLNVDARSFSYPGSGLFKPDLSKQLFEMRRLRLDVKATLAKYIKIKFSEDFAANEAGDTPETKEAWINYGYFSFANIQVGQSQYPFSSEDAGSSKYYAFLEQATITAALASGEDRGILFIGNSDNNRYHYELGLMNGAGANLADNNDSLDTAVRFVLNPADLEEENKYWMGISYSTGSQTVVADQNDALSLRTESRSKKKFFVAEFEPDRKFTKTRQGLDATYLYGPTTVKGEYMRGDFKFDGAAALQGMYFFVGHFLTGEQRSVENGLFEKQTVDEPYDPKGDGRGAIELTLRYSTFHADPKFFEEDSLYPGWVCASCSKYVNAGYTWTYGVNWYLDSMARIQFNYVQGYAAKEMIKSFGKTLGMSGKAAESAILVRFAQEF